MFGYTKNGFVNFNFKIYNLKVIRAIHYKQIWNVSEVEISPVYGYRL